MDELNIQNMPLYESLDRDVFTKISNAICTNRYSLKRLSERYFLVSVEEFDFVYDKKECIWDSNIFNSPCNVYDDELIGNLINNLDLILDEQTII